MPEVRVARTRRTCGAVVLAQPLQPRDRFVDVLEQMSFFWIRLVRRAGPAHGGDVGRLAGVRAPQGVQVSEPVSAGKQTRVGHAVGGPGQQIRETDGLTQGRREDHEREVEAPADLPQKTAEQVVGHASRGRTVSAAGPGRPSPS